MPLQIHDWHGTLCSPMEEHELHIRRVGDIVHFSGQLEWMHTQDSASGHFLAACPALNIFLEADTREELFSLISESIDETLKNVVKHDDLPGFLAECGWNGNIVEVEGENITDFPRINLNPVSLHDFQTAACN